jgi:hypothetical protein
MKLIVAALASTALLLPMTSSALQATEQVEITLACFESGSMQQHLREKYGEVPSVRFRDEGKGAEIVIFVNPATNTWTLAGVKGEDQLCFIMGGDKVIPIPQGSSSRRSVPKPTL